MVTHSYSNANSTCTIITPRGKTGSDGFAIVLQRIINAIAEINKHISNIFNYNFVDNLMQYSWKKKSLQQFSFEKLNYHDSFDSSAS